MDHALSDLTDRVTNLQGRVEELALTMPKPLPTHYKIGFGISVLTFVLPIIWIGGQTLAQIQYISKQVATIQSQVEQINTIGVLETRLRTMEEEVRRLRDQRVR